MSVFPKIPKRSQTEPTQILGSRVPTRNLPPREGCVRTESLPLTPPLETPPVELNLAGSRLQPKEDTTEKKREIEQPRKQFRGLERSETSQHLRPTSSSKLPSRPSRTGTEPLVLESSPVIQSNLSSSRLPTHRRQTSADSGSGYRIVGHGSVSTDSFHLKPSSRTPNRSISPSKFTSRAPNATASAGQAQVSRSRSFLVKDPKEIKDTEAATKNTSTRRFGLFSKKSKPSLDAPRSEQGDKSSRRGPAAGTGHECYGRYAQRGRRTSIGSNTSRAHSTSTSGSTGNLSRAHSEIDDFLLHRLEPVVITGGAKNASSLTRTYSEQSVSSLSIASVATSQTPSIGPGYYAQSSESLISSTGRLVHSPEPITATAITALPKLKDERNPKSTIAKRRSFLKPKIFSKSDPNKSLSVNTDLPRLAPPVDSSNTCRTSMSQSDVSVITREGDKWGAKEAKKSKSQKLGGKWNFLQRSHQLRRKDHFTEAELASVTKVSVSVSQVGPSRTVAHYALLDSEPVESDTLEDVLNHIEESPPTTEDEPQKSPKQRNLRRQQSVLLPEPPVKLSEYRSGRRPSSPKVFFNKEMPTGLLEEEPRASGSTRLKSIGRIPLVVSRGNRQHKPPVQSFSRPFSRADMPSIPAMSEIGLSEPSEYPVCDMPLSDVLTKPAIYNVLDTSAFADFGSTQCRLPADQPPSAEFLAFSPRKNSEVSESTSNESHKSSSKAITAVMPAPGSKLTEDEIWDEYDDFIDKVLTPPAADQKRSSPRNSFKQATRASIALQAGLNATAMDSRSSRQSECSATATPSSPLPTHSVHLSRSMILSALHASSIGPSSPMSLNELYSSYEERGRTVVDFATLDNLSPLPIPPSPQGIIDEKAPAKELDRQRNTILLDIAERERLGALAQANLRSGSLMTSKWLSFGRVLLSPAQNHVQTEDQARILVIDGLGNDDWSFYCALTYPKATVYNLSALPPVSTNNHPAAWDPPSNHRSVHHANLEHPFPFPKGFFTVAILRFPAACSEAGLRNTVSECKRVLRTGGYLEMSILDLDMVNMGSRTRKAVRKLKERMFTTDPSISLKPASDNIQRLLGKRGFQNLNRCTVVVPVAGTIVQSSDSSNSGFSTIATSVMTPNGSQLSRSMLTTSGTLDSRRPPSDDVNVSLGDLLSDPSPSASNDECITKMVAKVACWWYTRCYEALVLADGNLDGSIWAERRVVRECRRHGTGFKLLIAYAQKPSEVKRRTASV